MAFFDGAGSGTALVVLSAWLAVGATLCVLPSRRRERAALRTEPEPVAA